MLWWSNFLSLWFLYQLFSFFKRDFLSIILIMGTNWNAGKIIKPPSICTARVMEASKSLPRGCWHPVLGFDRTQPWAALWGLAQRSPRAPSNFRSSRNLESNLNLSCVLHPPCTKKCWLNYRCSQTVTCEQNTLNMGNSCSTDSTWEHYAKLFHRNSATLLLLLQWQCKCFD